MKTLEKINKLLKEKKFFIEKHYYSIENKLYRVKRVETKPNGDRVDIYLVYDTPMIPNVMHWYQYWAKKESWLDYLLRTLQARTIDDWLFYCWKWLDTLVYQK